MRSYLAAAARGDESTAAGYLAAGLPNETFLTNAAKIGDVSAARNADGSFKVTAEIAEPGGTYFETFKLVNGANGLQIADHFAIKVQ